MFRKILLASPAYFCSHSSDSSLFSLSLISPTLKFFIDSNISVELPPAFLQEEWSQCSSAPTQFWPTASLFPPLVHLTSEGSTPFSNVSPSTRVLYPLSSLLLWNQDLDSSFCFYNLQKDSRVHTSEKRLPFCCPWSCHSIFPISFTIDSLEALLALVAGASLPTTPT